MSVDVDASVKIIVVGNGGVGKTSMLRRFCKGDFTQDYKKTIGTDFMEKNVYARGSDQVVNLMLWDTAGQEVFDALTASYYRSAGGCVLAFSTVDRDSFMAVEKWKNKVEAQCGKGAVIMVLVQTKCDLMDTAAVSSAEAEALAKQHNLAFFRTSTKDNFNIGAVFEYLAERCVTSGNVGDSGREITVAGGGRPASNTTPAPATGGPDPEAKKGSEGGKKQQAFAAKEETSVPENGKVSMKPNKRRAPSKRKLCIIL
eukprot:PhF_6_TR19425/c0_g1_i1/m.28416/K06234/RAB23; Ras-related protein Rab-23